MRFLCILIVITGTITYCNAQTIDQFDDISTGYLDIKTDSLGAPLYIDGVFIGNAPLLQPVPVLSGFHEVSYLPPDIDLSNIKNRLTDAIKRVYVAANDTVSVTLFYEYQTSHFQSLRKERTISQYVGWSMIGISMYLLWRISS